MPYSLPISRDEVETLLNTSPDLETVMAELDHLRATCNYMSWISGDTKFYQIERSPDYYLCYAISDRTIIWRSIQLDEYNELDVGMRHVLIRA